jgi:hypothetical protein
LIEHWSISIPHLYTFYTLSPLQEETAWPNGVLRNALQAVGKDDQIPDGNQTIPDGNQTSYQSLAVRILERAAEYGPERSSFYNNIIIRIKYELIQITSHFVVFSFRYHVIVASAHPGPRQPLLWPWAGIYASKDKVIQLFHST